LRQARRLGVGVAESYVSLARNSIRSRDVRNNQISSNDVRNGSLVGADFAGGQLPAGPRGATGATGSAGPAGATGQTGQDGAQGSPGISGLERVSGASLTDSSSPKTATATCPAGKRSIGTGSDIAGGQSGPFPPNELTDVVIYDIVPSSHAQVPGSVTVTA